MKAHEITLVKHYRKLLFFNFKRFKGDNYRSMREYFADILIMEVEEFMPLWNKKVLDVGGAKGEFCKVISEKRNCDPTNLDPNPGQCIWANTVRGVADNMPFDDNEFDLVICRGVLEHIPPEKQQESVNEIYRVTKEGRMSYIMIPPWYNPHAGHGLKPFHMFPFKVAKYLREVICRDRIDANSFEEAGLYPITLKKMAKMISKSGFKVIATKDTHLRLHFLTKIPGIREIAVPSVVFIVRKQ